MGIDTQQIHNLVRTYQRALDQETLSRKPAAHGLHHDDRISVSTEAREHHRHKTVSTPAHQEKLRQP